MIFKKLFRMLIFGNSLPKQTLVSWTDTWQTPIQLEKVINVKKCWKPWNEKRWLKWKLEGYKQQTRALFLSVESCCGRKSRIQVKLFFVCWHIQIQIKIQMQISWVGWWTTGKYDHRKIWYLFSYQNHIFPFLASILIKPPMGRVQNAEVEQEAHWLGAKSIDANIDGLFQIAVMCCSGDNWFARWCDISCNIVGDMRRCFVVEVVTLEFESQLAESLTE